MKCSNCGNELTGTEKFCGSCGAPVNAVQQPVNYTPGSQQFQPQAPQMPQAHQMPQIPRTPQMQTGPNGNGRSGVQNGAGIAALVLGIIGLLTFWIYGLGAVLGIIGLVMSISSQKKVGTNGLAVAGLVLSIISIVFGSIFLACTLCLTSAATSIPSYRYFY